VEFPVKHLAVLISFHGQKITVTNVYSPPARSHNEMNTGSAIYALPQILEREGDHVVVGDSMYTTRGGQLTRRVTPTAWHKTCLILRNDLACSSSFPLAQLHGNGALPHQHWIYLSAPKIQPST
jgi:hypothetical protein